MFNAIVYTGHNYDHFRLQEIVLPVKREKLRKPRASIMCACCVVTGFSFAFPLRLSLSLSLSLSSPSSSYPSFSLLCLSLLPTLMNLSGHREATGGPFNWSSFTHAQRATKGNGRAYSFFFVLSRSLLLLSLFFLAFSFTFLSLFTGTSRSSSSESSIHSFIQTSGHSYTESVEAAAAAAAQSTKRRLCVN